MHCFLIGGCQAIFEIKEDTLADGGTIDSNVATFEVCRDSCLSQDDCIAFAFDSWSFSSDSLRCRYYQDASSLEETIGLLFSNIYIITNRCYNGETDIDLLLLFLFLLISVQEIYTKIHVCLRF